MIQGVREYFRTRQNEDAIVLFGQNLEYDYEVTQSDGSKVWDKKIHEKDAIVVNLTHGYIMNIEAKATLGYQEYKKGCEQLQETMRMVSNQIGPNIDSSWRIIMVLYGTNYDPCENICQSCAPYIITSEDDFKKKLENIIDNNIAMKRRKEFKTLD